MTDDRPEPGTASRTGTAEPPAPARRSGGGDRPGRRRWQLPVVVAAIVLLVVIGVLTLVTNSSDHDTPGGDGNRSAATSSTTTGPPSRARRLQLSDLGEFAPPTALRAALRLATTAPSPSPRRAAPELTEAQVDRCGTVIEARDPGLTRANRRRTLVATIDGEA